MIGAGIAGLTCARYLKDHGFHPIVFEKSRGLGGRLAARRAGDGVTFDHGAQYVTARSPPFQRLVEEAIKAGAAGYWRPRTGDPAAGEPDGWVVGTPAMNALIKPLARGLVVRLATEVTGIARDGDGWRVDTAAGTEADPFPLVICTAPAPQARALLAGEPGIADALARVSIAPCWALMLTFAAPLAVPFDVWRSASHNLAWIARNSSKPARGRSKDCWVVHAGSGWSQRHLELGRDRIAETMIAMLPSTLGTRLPELEHASAHRWRYALAAAPLGRPYLCSDDRTLFVGGDWCLGPRVEYAFDSGQVIARTLVRTRGT